MHTPIKHAAERMLQRAGHVSLEAWLAEHRDEPRNEALAKLAHETEYVIIVDVRTLDRWMDAADGE